MYKESLIYNEKDTYKIYIIKMYTKCLKCNMYEKKHKNVYKCII